MISRGKYQSLTMVNWNGFFARTFDIDNLVTTLSGGNGAGKSTTMAAFITALIPDQSLLHFRNTTEAGSSQSSRDKGLFGKLQPGCCYSALDVVNSRNQRLLFGVRLVQVAGRDKKVDIKPFLIMGLNSDIKPNDMFIENGLDGTARVRPINEVKTWVAAHGASLRLFNSVADYHGQMFELGVLPKKLRSTGDRSKFYRLIEASLYGGISSAITRSLRDYLLPQNGGVKQAFQDMEAALRENRLTLEAINATKRDRDLFKHLITESTAYVASDYMRHANERRQNIEKALNFRQSLYALKHDFVRNSERLELMTSQLDEAKERDSELEQNYQAASDHLQVVNSAIKQREKIERYQEELEELQERLEEQAMVVEEAEAAYQESEEMAHHFDDEADSLKSQLADYQQALDIQQTRVLQYQQAVNALNKAQALLEDDALSVEQVQPCIESLKVEQADVTDRVLTLRRRLSLIEAETLQFDKAFSLLSKIEGNVEHENAAQLAVEVTHRFEHAQSDAAMLPSLRQRLHEAEKSQAQRTQLLQLKTQCEHETHSQFHSVDDIELAIEQHEEQALQVADKLELLRENKSQLNHQKQRIADAIVPLKNAAPQWHIAAQKLIELREQTGHDLEDSQAVLSHVRWLLEEEHSASNRKQNMLARREELDAQISRLSISGNGEEPRFQALAEQLGGVLLAEIYDDIPIDDAPYFSAVYGPARHAIVVSNLDGIQEQLSQIDDCPDDVYVIEGDINAFDDSHFEAQEFEGAVCVKLNERQIRYSRLPKVSQFGRAAREQQLAELRDEREQLVVDLAKVSFDAQKLERTYQALNTFVSEQMSLAFSPSPEEQVDALEEELYGVAQKLSAADEEIQQLQSKAKGLNQYASLLKQLEAAQEMLFNLPEQNNIEQLREDVARAITSESWLKQHQDTVIALKPIMSVLSTPPQTSDELKQQYDVCDSALQRINERLFALSDVVERRHHFSYADAVAVVDQSSELNEQLKQRLATIEQQRLDARQKVKLVRDQLSQYQQVLASLKSAHAAKHEMHVELKQEFELLGVTANEQTLENAEQRKASLFEQLQALRETRSQLEREITAIQLEVAGFAKQAKKLEREYKDLRAVVVRAKANLCSVLKLARDADVERRLVKPELAYLAAGDLRSMSDKALGALRQAVAGNEELRDALRLSEDNARPERKILFYIAVYQHLKARIRQDILRTDDPVQAIEEMEIELARLAEELSQRESRLAISSNAVASIIRKTIQREEQRIRMLNQGLSNIAFGQVNGVRLNVKIRNSHETLLDALTNKQEQHKDLFESKRMTFSEAVATLFQRVNPHIDMGQRSAQVLGEELLDYRNYLELSVEVNRGSDGWLQAESGALSTGEAIGTGQSILLMVVQSWEEESRRLRSKDIVPCRLLFLDEAARLDAKSIATLFELCERLDMQLLIAAPENISPERGTTYKLIRKVFKDHEHVHVVGLRGFGYSGDAPKSDTPQLSFEEGVEEETQH